jgi:hypothetical protein
MRRLGAGFLAFALAAGSASGAAWTKIVDRERQFTMRFPGEPIAEDAEYRTASGAVLPARIYSLERDTARYRLTIIDYAGHEKEEAGARGFAVETLKGKGKAVHDAHAWQDGLPGDHVVVAAPDGRRISAAVHLFEHRLYIAEASDVGGAATTEPFVTSLIITHKDGTWLNLDRFNPVDINAFEDPN